MTKEAITKLSEAIFRLIEDGRNEGGIIRDQLDDLIELHMKPFLPSEEMFPKSRASIAKVTEDVHNVFNNSDKSPTEILNDAFKRMEDMRSPFKSPVQQMGQAGAFEVQQRTKDLDNCRMVIGVDPAGPDADKRVMVVRNALGDEHYIPITGAVLPVHLSNEIEESLAKDDASIFGNGFMSVTVKDGKTIFNRLDPKEVRINQLFSEAQDVVAKRRDEINAKIGK